MSRSFDYAETLRVLRDTKVQAVGNAWAFGVRAGSSPSLLSPHAWRELGEIESLLEHTLRDVIRRELRAEPAPYFSFLKARWRGLRVGLGNEDSAVRRLLSELTQSSVDQWREGAPQLEASLWPFLTDRTHYLANTLSLALSEPAPYPAMIWHPGRREFSSRAGNA